MTSRNFRHYRVFYLPLRDLYGDIVASNRRKRQSAQPGESYMNFNEASGTLIDLNGAVTYRIQVAVVTVFNDDEVIGDRSAAIERTTLEGGKQILLLHNYYVSIICHIVPTAPRNLKYTNSNVSNEMFNVTLTWSRPDPPNGFITHYNVSNIAND